MFAHLKYVEMFVCVASTFKWKLSFIIIFFFDQAHLFAFLKYDYYMLELWMVMTLIFAFY
jgi:hypothetical protein